MDEALADAGRRLQKARRPLLIAGSMDVNGARSILKMARHYKAIVSHTAADSFLRNLRVMQETGWISATLNEPVNRADLLVVVGQQLFSDYPRLAERLMQEKRLYRKQPAEVILLADWQQISDVPAELQERKPCIMTVKPEQMLNFLRRLALHIKAKDNPNDHDDAAGLAKKLKAAQYSAIVWSAAELPTQYSDLYLHGLAHCIRLLNEKTRCVMVPVGAKDTNNTFAQVCLWNHAYPGELSFQRGFVEYDPYLFNGQRVLEQAEADLLVWISPLKPAAPPKSDIDTIALVHPGLPADPALAVQIPTAVPGVDHGGHLHRLDNVVVLPLPALRQSKLPSASMLINQLLDSSTKKIS